MSEMAPEKPVVTECSVDGCHKRRCLSGSFMCSMHAARWRRHGDVNHLTYGKGDPVERFWAKVDLRGENDCWIYKGTVRSDGYGIFTAGKAFQTGAHRFSYQDQLGPIPDGLHIDHLCCVPLCVNPNHLEPVTNAENVRRRWIRQRAQEAAK